MRLYFYKPGFTLVEILITVALIALIGATIPLTMNFKKQLDRSNDVKRKKDLSVVRSAMDEFYNDHGGYPTGDQICFNTTDTTRYVDSLGLNEGCVCNICGKKVVGTNVAQQVMFSYIKEIPCDPNSSGISSVTDADYIYNYDCNSASAQPQWYRIYAKLVTSDDPGIVESGCESGCGPKYIVTAGPKELNTNYKQISNNYAVTSSNISPETGTIACGSYSGLYCINSSNRCMACGASDSCEVSCPVNSALYIEDQCKSKCK